MKIKNRAIPTHMKTLIEYAESAWQHAFEISFKENTPCPADMFTTQWVEKNAPGKWDNQAGWYWILTDAP
ncbi:hypothetical protein [Myxococcus sp. RHSTA-1-4]|uniref:hypothetical protein n=1 Tax=Myxococcus sp. RHSTA-1-4 TaxID=2874601 RepID=UPI001CC07AC8|nr:hypothetical protein [Myxococcus sp. RHSTA-1-4]MBZ4416099.1 hypothetical protein [Myxococcus sp. RHSTA-1-4]